MHDTTVDRVTDGRGLVSSKALKEMVRAEIQKVVDEANAKFARIEQVKKFAILPRDLSQEDNELTPTLKVKRNVVYSQHAGTFEGLYGEA